ncbi:Glycosyl transferase family 2 [Mucilaginibacter gossypiicola]|uniref:Glycosyl transferase family 2 n=1 Tax=Mucilaginibacter gossypiicola TaxID=551995 RepID=A0A1H8N3U3_9SPHI|nr:glycosyltransferase family 2 protein [Mucilaginibacter gossypiicola]SEO24254.1 Glycosyl transferase family 2 [Mucilaginibacter gossypiicola]
MKISVVTIIYNTKDTIKRCIESVISQDYNNIEYIIIDGGSTDGSLQIINQYKSHIQVLVSEPDQGIYDAMNKGIRLATGEIVGTLNADDFFADQGVISEVAQAFSDNVADIIYGNLDYINSANKIIRKWKSHKCGKNSFNRGFMPPHPTFYCKRYLFEKHGFYSLDYGSAADYELMARFMHKWQISSLHLNKVMVNMQVGGVSNSNLINRIKAWSFDLKAMRENNVFLPVLAIVLKPLRKIFQFL